MQPIRLWFEPDALTIHATICTTSTRTVMFSTTSSASRLEDRFVSAFKLQEGHTLNGNNAHVQGLRWQAIESFDRLGLPTSRAEAWKYTPIEKIVQRDYQLHTAPGRIIPDRDTVSRFVVPDLDAYVVVLVNGRFIAELSSVDHPSGGMIVTGLAEAGEAHADVVNHHFARYADSAGEAFTALNTAFTQDGLFVFVPRGLSVDKPLHVINLIQAEEAQWLNPRHLIVVEQGAELTIIESNHSLTQAPTFTNSVTEVFVGAEARAMLYRLQDEGAAASHVAGIQVYQERDSVFSGFTVTLSGEVVRNNMNVLPDAQHTESHLFGLFLGDGRMHVDNHTLVDHARPHCQSNELYKGILDDEATGVFNGKVYVRRDAQQTNAYQSSKSVVLTNTARMYSKPELEIYADDVKCSHGATTGHLDSEAIFYLQSRGITAQRARAMLLLAFARDVLENVTIEPLRVMLDHIVESRFHE